MVDWNLKMKPPKIALGGTKIDFSGFLAPMVMPGEYTIKLVVGDSSYTTPIKLVHDASNKEFTLADREAQYKTAMEIYKMHEQLASVVDIINAKQKIIKSVAHEGALSRARMTRQKTMPLGGSST